MGDCSGGSSVNLMSREERKIILMEAYRIDQEYYEQGYDTIWGVWRHRLAEWLLKGHRLLRHSPIRIPEEDRDGCIEIRR